MALAADMNSQNTNKTPDANTTNDSAIVIDTPTPLELIKIRLSSKQAQHLWDKGYRFEDLRAILKVHDTEFPVKLMYPSNSMAELPKDPAPKTGLLEEEFTVPYEDDGYSLKWIKFPYQNLHCPCYFKTDAITERHIALCDHLWHDLCLTSKHLRITSICVAYSRAKGEWLAHVYANGGNFISRRTSRSEAVNAAVLDAFTATRQPLDIRKVTPNMDNSDRGLASQDATGPDQLEAVRDGNVAITTARGESSAQTAEIPPTNTKTEYYSETPAIFRHLTDRDLALPTLTWSADQAAGTVIAQYDLPYDIIAHNHTSPNYAPFLTYAQVEPNLTIRVQLQSVPTNGGTLVVGVRYAALDEIANQSQWALINVAQLVQTNHIMLSAQSSNSSELCIPFQYFLDRVPTTWNNQSNMLYYATMYVAVLNPLVVAPEAQNFVDVNFYCSFQCNGVPTRFFGQRNYFDPFAAGPLSRITGKRLALRKVTPNGAMISTIGNVVQAAAPIANIIEPGLGGVIKTIGKATGDIGKALPFSSFMVNGQPAETAPIDSDNRPLLTTDHPQAVLVQTHGLAITSAPLDAKSMRLQKEYTTPQPPGRLDLHSALSNKYITSVHGLLSNNIVIDSASTAGAIIYEWNVTPADGIRANDRFYPTPLCAMCYTYTYYSGDLVITAVVGSALMHSVRLRFQYIPDYSDALVAGQTPLEDRNNYFSTVFDIQEQTQFSFKIPYQSLTPMNPIWQTLAYPELGQRPLRYSYGTFRIILETPLKANNSVSPTVHMSLLLSGDDNFQLAVPRSCVYPPIDNVVPTRERRKVTPNMEERFNDPSTISPQPSGASGIPRHIGERHDISDLIHRYCVIAEDTVEILTSTTAQFIVADWPVNASIPNARIGGIRRFARDGNNAMQNTRQIDPLTHIQDAFRFNKGSIRYMISVACALPLKFDVLHLPYIAQSQPTTIQSPLGLTIVKQSTPPAFIGNLDDNNGSGVALEYFDTTYNSTISLEIPYYQHTSCLLSDAISSNTLEETWSSYSNGHIRLISRPFFNYPGSNPSLIESFPLTVTLYRAAGNDMHLSAFQGFPPRDSIMDTIPVQSAGRVPAPPPPPPPKPAETPKPTTTTTVPPTTDKSDAILKSSTGPGVESDFKYSYAKLEKHAQRAIKLALRKVTPNMLAAARGALDIPVSVNHTIRQSARVVGAVADMIDTTSSSIAQITNLITRIFEPFAENFNTTSFIAHIIVLRDKNNTIFSRISAFFGILGLVGIFTVKTLTTIIKLAYDYFNRETFRPLEPNNVDPRRRLVTPNINDEAPNNDLVEICSLFSTGLATVFGIFDANGLAKKCMSVSNMLAKQRSVERFFELAIKWIRIGIAWAKGEKDPETIHAENLQAHSREIKEWSTEVDLLTSLHNQDRIFSSPSLQRRVSAAKQKGVAYFEQLDELPRGVCQAITFYYRRICELYDQIGMRLGGGAIPVEPISIWLYGKPGCGKSYLLDSLSIHIMRMLGIVYNGDPIYTRDGNKYWNGYVGQPCIKYDDVGVIRSPTWMETFVGEFFSLHTCATFNPDQADIRDKNRIVNARLVAVASNKTTHKDFVGHGDAFKRRRDFVIAARQNPNWFAKHAPGALNCNDPRLTGDMLKNFDHICFRFQDKMDDADYTDCTDGWMTYRELLKELQPQVEAISSRRSFAAKSRQGMADALSPAYWDSVGQTSDAPELADLAADLDTRARMMVEPNMYGYAAEMMGSAIARVADFFSPRLDARYEVDTYYTHFAMPHGTYPDVNSTHYQTEFESGIDFTRIGCAHHELTLEYSFDVTTSTYNFGSLSIPSGECGLTCSLTAAGLLQLCRAYNHGIEINNGARIADGPGPNRDANGNVTNSVEGHVRFDRPRFNLHHIIDSIMNRYTNFTFPHNSYLARYSSLIYVSIEVLAIVGICAGLGYFEDHIERKREEAAVERIISKLQERLDKGTDDLDTYDSNPNIQQSGDVKTRKVATTNRKTAVRRVAPNAPTGIVPLINKNFIDISYFRRSGPGTNGMGAFMLGDRTAICPMHMWESLNLDNEYEWTEVPVTPQEYSNLAQRQVKHVFVDREITGPVKFTCKGKMPLFTDYATSRQTTFADKPETFNLLATEFETKKRDYVLSLCDYAASDDGRLIYVNNGATRVRVRYENITFHELNTDEQIDLACFTFNDTCVPQARSVLHNFAKDAEFDRINFSEIELVLANENRSIYLNRCRETSFICDYEKFPSKTIIGLEYDNPTGYYPCSSILVDTRHSKILGFHTCSSASLGFSLYIPLEILPKLAFSIPDMPEIAAAPSKFNLSGEFITIGTSPNIINQPFKSSLKHSIIHDQFESFRFPAALRSREDTFPGEVPLRKGCEKQTVSPPLPETPEETRLVNEYLHNLILTTATPTHTVKPHLSVGEALQGIPGVPFMDPLKLTTSAGWPYNTESKTLKRHYVTRDNDGNITNIDETFMNNYNDYHKARLEGKRPCTVFTDFLKDERLKAGKDTRLINGSPFEYTIEMRRYFLAFVSAVKSRRFINGMAIGMNVHSPDVTELVNLLRNKGDHYICGDYHSFGPTLDPNAVRELGVLVNQWYDRYCPENTPTDNRIRTDLLNDANNALHLAYDLFYVVLCGSPSGSPLTDLVNSYANLRYMCRAWLHIMAPYPHLTPLSVFHAKVFKAVYGDDVIMSTTKDIAEVFNNSTLSDYFSTIGITYTDATKTGAEPFCGLDKASFLKCGFIPHPTRKGQWLAALDWKCVAETPAWIRKSASDEDATIENCNAALLNAHGHGPEKYNMLRGKVTEALQNLNIPYSAPTWTQTDNNFYDSPNHGYMPY